VTWLPQRQSGPDVILLRDYPAGEVVRITCRYCPRAGRYRLARLIERFGPAAALPEVLAALSADYPRRQDWRINGPCGAGFPDLVGRLRS
jgi:hypothetical protein